MADSSIYLNAAGVICALGDSLQSVLDGIQSGQNTMTFSEEYASGTPVPLGIFRGTLPDISLNDAHWHSRNNQFALSAFDQIRKDVQNAIEQYGHHRVGVIVGTSTSGISDAEQALSVRENDGAIPDWYDYQQQEMGATARFIAEISGAGGPVYGISTACSSGAKALASARRLIRAGICDAVIAGGVDTLCQLTVQGFSSLEAVSDRICNPFSKNRKGINIGEGGALFLVSAEASGVELKGVGESSDAHHISAPDPTGAGAMQCMRSALDDAGIDAKELDYVNLHGTATVLNDQMEARAMAEVCGSQVPCSSTKPFTGHTLGAAGAVEAVICWLLLTEPEGHRLPVQLWDQQQDPDLPDINLVCDDHLPVKRIDFTLSNSFAFGGNNIALVFGRLHES